MNTEALIDRLATHVQPIPERVGQRRLLRALAWGTLGSVLWLSWLYGPRADWREAMTWPAFWAKLLLPMAVAVASLVWAYRLMHPGAREGHARGWSLLPVLVLWTWAAWAWFGADPMQRPSLLWGQTWRVCVWNILGMSLPWALALLWAARGLAPTRPARTGAAVGWAAGGMGAAVYALHCPEMAAPFLAVWYVLGMALVAGLSSLAGSRVLRW
jgi:hypothetical protein